MAPVVNTKYVGNIITLGTGKVLKEQVGGYWFKLLLPGF